jgi:hypothetical protein
VSQSVDGRSACRRWLGFVPVGFRRFFVRRSIFGPCASFARTAAAAARLRAALLARLRPSASAPRTRRERQVSMWSRKSRWASRRRRPPHRRDSVCDAGEQGAHWRRAAVGVGRVTPCGALHRRAERDHVGERRRTGARPPRPLGSSPAWRRCRSSAPTFRAQRTPLPALRREGPLGLPLCR